MSMKDYLSELPPPSEVKAKLDANRAEARALRRLLQLAREAEAARQAAKEALS